MSDPFVPPACDGEYIEHLYHFTRYFGFNNIEVPLYLAVLGQHVVIEYWKRHPTPPTAHPHATLCDKIRHLYDTFDFHDDHIRGEFNERLCTPAELSNLQHNCDHVEALLACVAREATATVTAENARLQAENARLQTENAQLQVAMADCKAELVAPLTQIAVRLEAGTKTLVDNAALMQNFVPRLVEHLQGGGVGGAAPTLASDIAALADGAYRDRCATLEQELATAKTTLEHELATTKTTLGEANRRLAQLHAADAEAQAQVARLQETATRSARELERTKAELDQAKAEVARTEVKLQSHAAQLAACVAESAAKGALLETAQARIAELTERRLQSDDPAPVHDEYEGRMEDGDDSTRDDDATDRDEDPPVGGTTSADDASLRARVDGLLNAHGCIVEYQTAIYALIEAVKPKLVHLQWEAAMTLERDRDNQSPFSLDAKDNRDLQRDRMGCALFPNSVCEELDEFVTQASVLRDKCATNLRARIEAAVPDTAMSASILNNLLTVQDTCALCPLHHLMMTTMVPKLMQQDFDDLFHFDASRGSVHNVQLAMSLGMDTDDLIDFMFLHRALPSTTKRLALFENPELTGSDNIAGSACLALIYSESVMSKAPFSQFLVDSVSENHAVLASMHVALTRVFQPLVWMREQGPHAPPMFIETGVVTDTLKRARRILWDFKPWLHNHDRNRFSWGSRKSAMLEMVDTTTRVLSPTALVPMPTLEVVLAALLMTNSGERFLLGEGSLAVTDPSEEIEKDFLEMCKASDAFTGSSVTCMEQLTGVEWMHRDCDSLPIPALFDAAKGQPVCVTRPGFEALLAASRVAHPHHEV